MQTSALQHTCERAPSERTGFVLFPGVLELDYVGPLQVFQKWHERENWGGQLNYLIGSSSEIRCSGGTEIRPSYTFVDAPPIDILVVPGGPGTRDESVTPLVADFIRAQSKHVRKILSVCSGSLLLEHAGLLEDIPATSHWRYHQQLLQKGHQILSQRYVKAYSEKYNLEIWTSAGVSAGIDMALAYVAENAASTERAGQVQLDLEYFPSRHRYDPGEAERVHIPDYVLRSDLNS
jgi:transcriptional regulator GlxA family with amidase domain